MEEIRYIDRATGEEKTEKVYGGSLLAFLYGKNPLAGPIRHFLCKIPYFSRQFGKSQRNPKSRKKIATFIEQFGVDTAEFRDPVDSFTCFNDFFVRHLKPEARPIAPGDDVAVLPADGRYFAYQSIHEVDGIHVKGRTLSLSKLLGSSDLAKKYSEGALVIARLAPVDYHRYHFPASGVPAPTKKIGGPLYSVNPLALRRNLDILTENKRAITPLATQKFGTVQIIEVGATYVGTIHQTFTPGTPVAKGEEKGFFSFGGSCIILLFEPSKIALAPDLLENTQKGLETLGRMGQVLGTAN